MAAASRHAEYAAGAESALNLPFSPPQVECLYGIEPWSGQLKMAQRQTASVAFPVGGTKNWHVTDS
jgi:hypothetical protein